jgi:hypothetical protein
MRWYRMGILGGVAEAAVGKSDVSPPFSGATTEPEPIAEPIPAPVQAAEVALVEAALVEDELDEATKPGDADDALEAELEADLTPPPRKA